VQRKPAKVTLSSRLPTNLEINNTHIVRSEAEDPFSIRVTDISPINREGVTPLMSAVEVDVTSPKTLRDDFSMK